MVTQGTSFTIESVHIGDPMPQVVCACALFDTSSTEENIWPSLLTFIDTFPCKKQRAMLIS